MGLSAEEIRQHHRALYEHLIALVPEDDAVSNPEGLVRFLREELLPHAQEEERELYDRIESHIPPGEVTRTMRLDHEAIVWYTEELARLAATLPSAEGDERVQQTRRFVRRAQELAAIVRLHLEKEERAYLPVYEQLTRERVLDVRTVPPSQRHSLIFQTFESLPLGEAFILVNDHDPKPLYYQFQAERAGTFSWDYVESGPEVWRVRIGKVG